MNWWKTAAGKDTEKVWLEGELKQSREGFVYVDVPDALVSPMMRMIPDDKIVHPSEASDKYSGCHISVMRGSEIDNKRVKEAGDIIRYQIIGVESVAPEGWEGVDKVYFLTVYSPDLEALREKYDLSRKYKDHDFHITVAVVKG